MSLIMIPRRPGRALVAISAIVMALSCFAAAAPAALAASRAPRAREHPSKLGHSVVAHHMKGGRLFKHPAPRIVDHDQGGPLKLANGPLRVRGKQHTTVFLPAGQFGAVPRTPAASISVSVNTAHAVPTTLNPAEPSEASDGRVVVYTTNDRVGFSVNGGASFAVFNPASMYSDDPFGGADGDQVVQYVPQINRFVWLDQYWANAAGANEDRIAVFPPSAVTATGLSSWTYWDITAASFSLPRPFLDFPDLAVGSGYLYLSSNNGQGGKVYSSVIARIGLTNLQKGLNLAAAPQPWRYVTGALFFGRVAQHTGSVAYWAQNSSTSQIQVSDWPESSVFWFGPTTVNIYTWPNANYTTKEPDGNKWLSTYTGTILAAAVTPSAAGAQNGGLWLAWTGGIGSGRLAWLSQPQIELVELALPSFTFVSQTAIWNPAYAISYPALNVSQNGHLGIALAAGGSGHWANSAVADWTAAPFAGWYITSSNTSCKCNRYGDYIAMRPAYGTKSAFTASGYGTDTAGKSGWAYDPHFAQFTISP
jgi:hypothetical protein